jgi:E3 ubiquitin-protein ligase HERC2
MTLPELPFELLTHVCQHLGLKDLVRFAATCKLFHHSGGLETLELPTKSPVVTVLRTLALRRPELVASVRPEGCCESWVACLARCARQCCCRENPPVAAGFGHSLFIDSAGRLLECGYVLGNDGDALVSHFLPTPMAAMAEIRVRNVAADVQSSFALGWNGRVYSWGCNDCGRLGHGDTLARTAPTLVEQLEGVRGIAMTGSCSFAVTQAGAVFRWGASLIPRAEEDALRPIIVEGLGGVRVCRVCYGRDHAYAIGEDGELLSWGCADYGLLGHGDGQNQPLPKRVEALRGVRVNSVSIGVVFVLALAENGQVDAWGDNGSDRAALGNPDLEWEPLPKPIEALRGVHVCSMAAHEMRAYALADTGELWAWGQGRSEDWAPRGHGKEGRCRVPKRIASLRSIKLDAVVAGHRHTLALSGNGRVYAWGGSGAACSGALGLGPSVGGGQSHVPTPRRIPALRVVCGL